MSRRQMAKATAVAFGTLMSVANRPASAIQAPGATPAATPLPTAGWPFYGKGLTGTRASDETGISSFNIGTLAPLWEAQVGGPVSATPVIQDETAYVGSYDGTLYALGLRDGATRWTYKTGATAHEPNLKIPLGIPGSAAISGDTVFVGDADGAVHAIHIDNGQLLWRTQADTQPNASIWSSPVVFDGMVFVGVASIAKETGFRGNLVALDRDTGELLWKTYMVPAGADGGGVFASPVIDRSRRLLFVGTQNAYSAQPAPFGNPDSVVALDIDSGELGWVHHAFSSDDNAAPTDDVAFSASPNLFSIQKDGEILDIVGVGQKSGDYWALNRATGDVVWQTKISPAGPLGGMEGTSAVSDGVIAVPATDWPTPDGAATGLVSGVSASTGTVEWTAKQVAPAASPAAISNDLVLQAGMDAMLHAYRLDNGNELYSHELGASVSGGLAAARGVVVFGAATPKFAPFVKSGSAIHAFAVSR